MSVIWHDLECGSYDADLDLWLELARERGDAVLDIGAGTGRTALHLAAAGINVTALDCEAELLDALGDRAQSQGLEVETVVADARSFSLYRQFSLCIVPMQTIQLLGGTAGRQRFLGCAREHLGEGGRLAIALADELDLFEVVDGQPAPLPDVRELDGIVYSSRPTAVRAEDDGFVLERRRETVFIDGRLDVELDRIRLDGLDADTLEAEASAAGLRPTGRRVIEPTDDYTGSVVVILGG
ncbi:MAG: class I SAM-dependent methyltransferase [Solirubrobacteraceae bacterium]